MGGAPNTAAYTQLATKLESLINTCLHPNVLPDIARRVGSASSHSLPDALCLETVALKNMSLMACIKLQNIMLHDLPNLLCSFCMLVYC